MIKKKSRRPITRYFWMWLKYMPDWLRARVIRSQFECSYDLPSDLIFKPADSVHEIEQAWQLVLDSYVELGYTETNAARLRFNQFLGLPTTVILVGKVGDEVVATMSIIVDSSIGLPIEESCSVEQYRQQGQHLAEISALAIKRNFHLRRGKLLFPLCRLMYHYCREILKIDSIVISATVEVEAFYTDILLFERIKDMSGKPNLKVKGNPSCFCILPLNQHTVDSWKKIYARKKNSRNLYHYFLEAQINNIILIKDKICLQSYLKNKNEALLQILKKHRFLLQDFSTQDKLVIKNLDISNSFSTLMNGKNPDSLPRSSPRYVVRLEGWLLSSQYLLPHSCKLIDVTSAGVQVQLNDPNVQFAQGDQLIINFQVQNNLVYAKAVVKWVKKNSRLGCEISETNPSWECFIQQLHSEINTENNVLAFALKKVS